MAFTLGEISRLVRGRLHGDPSIVIRGSAIIRDAQAGQITLADSAKAVSALAECGASAVIVGEGVTVDHMAYIQVERVHAAFKTVVECFRPRVRESHQGISQHAFVDPTAQIGRDVTIFPGVYVGPQVELGDRVVLYPGVCVMGGSTIGADSVLHANVVLYEGTEVGSNCLIHASAVLGAYGFGYETREGRHVLSAQSGYVRLENHVEIGAGTTIDRGTYGPTVIGEGSKLDNQVMVAHNCRIGRHNLLCSQVGIAGSSTTGDYVVMAGQVGVGDHLAIGSKTILAAKAGVMNDVPSDSIFVGIPATPHREQMQKQAAWSKLPEMRKEFKAMQKELADLRARLEGMGRREAA